MLDIKIVLPITAFTKEAKAFVDIQMVDKPFGTKYFIEIIPQATPFSESELEGQIRTCYSRANQSIFMWHQCTKKKVDEVKQFNKREDCNSGDLLEIIFHSHDKLDTVLPYQVSNYIVSWYEKHKALIEFLVEG